MQDIDSDGSQGLSLQEMAEWMMRLEKTEAMKGLHRDFHEADRNHNGYVTLAEFAHTMANFGECKGREGGGREEEGRERGGRERGGRERGGGEGERGEGERRRERGGRERGGRERGGRERGGRERGGRGTGYTYMPCSKIVLQFIGMYQNSICWYNWCGWHQVAAELTGCLAVVPMASVPCVAM